MKSLPDVSLVPGSVPHGATFRAAAEALVEHSLTAIAILDSDGHVVGLFGGQDLVRGFFPAYLEELRHTAFAEDDPGILDERAREVSEEPVEKHMRPPVAVEEDSSVLHVAERFLHCDFGAIAVVRHGRFVGMLQRTDFCRAALERAG